MHLGGFVLNRISFSGFWLRDIDGPGAEALLEQDLHLNIPGDGSTVIYPCEAVLAEIERHQGETLDVNLERLAAGLKVLQPGTYIFI
jgi:hypothetical protein